MKSPFKPTRYNLRKPVTRISPEQQKAIPVLGRDNSPSPPTKRKPSVNPLDVLLKEKQTVNGKDMMRSADREARLRDLANMNLNDDSDNGDVDLSASGDNLPLAVEADGNPFIDDDQKKQVMEILEGDRAIKDEEEHLRQQGKVGVILWGISETGSMDSCGGLPPLEYQGSDPTLRSFAETVNHGNYDFVDLVIQSGALELANYTEGGSDVIQYLIGLGGCFWRCKCISNSRKSVTSSFSESRRPRRFGFSSVIHPPGKSHSYKTRIASPAPLVCSSCPRCSPLTIGEAGLVRW